MPIAGVSPADLTVLRLLDGEWTLRGTDRAEPIEVAGVPVEAGWLRAVRSGDTLRIGANLMRFEVPGGTNAALALPGNTKDVALALIAHVQKAYDDDVPRVRAVEGPSFRLALRLADEGRAYVVGRDPQCEMALRDSDVSRKHVALRRAGNRVFIRDLGSKNCAELGTTAIQGEIEWAPHLSLRLGRTVLSLIVPFEHALAQVERTAAWQDALPPPPKMRSPAAPAAELPPTEAPVAESVIAPPIVVPASAAVVALAPVPVPSPPEQPRASRARELMPAIVLLLVVVVAVALAGWLLLA
ncbi:MAG: FHA domain-containing protein [Polyangiaceae bacterium]|nr:FHA domain-containing protein [Polyangiaceae bacterium]